MLDIAQVDSRFKNSQATKRRIQKLQGLTDREKDLTNRKLFSADFKSGRKAAKHLGFKSNTARYKIKTLIHVSENLRKSCESLL